MRVKKVLALWIAVLVTLSFFGCKESQDTDSTQAGDTQTDEKAGNDENQEETVTLRMAWWGSQTRHDATNEVIEMYEADHPGVTIETEFFDMDSYFTKLDTLVAAGDVWDIFQLGGNFPKYINSIEPLNPYMDSGVIDVSDTGESFLKTTQNSDGTQVGISIGTNTNGIAYDPAMFQEAGMKEPGDNWTWADWKQACLQITDKLGVYGSSRMDNFIMGVTQGISQIEKDANFFNEDGTGLAWTDPTSIANYLSMIKELTDAGAYPDAGAIKEIGVDIENDYLVTGDAAMTYVASNQLIAIVNAAGRELRIAPIPRQRADGPYGMIVQSSQMLSLSKNSKHKEEAAKFIDYFVNSIEANQVLNGERGVPIMTKVRDAVKAQADESGRMMFDFVDQIGNYPPENSNVISPEPKTEIEDQYKLLVERVQLGEITPEDAAREFMDFAESKF